VRAVSRRYRPSRRELELRLLDLEEQVVATSRRVDAIFDLMRQIGGEATGRKPARYRGHLHLVRASDGSRT
jgi:hypothetical protein